MTRVTTLNATWAEEPHATVREVVDRHLTQGWEITESQSAGGVLISARLQHPALSGTTKVVGQ